MVKLHWAVLIKVHYGHTHTLYTVHTHTQKLTDVGVTPSGVKVCLWLHTALTSDTAHKTALSLSTTPFANTSHSAVINAWKTLVILHFKPWPAYKNGWNYNKSISLVIFYEIFLLFFFLNQPLLIKLRIICWAHVLQTVVKSHNHTNTSDCCSVMYSPAINHLMYWKDSSKKKKKV